MAEPILTAAETRAAEQRAIDAGISVTALMERAGAAVAEAAWRLAGRTDTLVLCGPGNNGGDGYVAARLLAERGVPVRVAAEGAPRSDAACAAAAGWTGAVETLVGAERAPVVIDALYGTGLARPLSDATLATLSRLVAAARLSIAVDLPSGIASDGGAAPEAVPTFDLTITLGARKPAHCLLPAVAKCGRVVVADIGLVPDAPTLTRIDRPVLRAPGTSDTKYTRGKLLVIGGAMPGAATLAALAGQRAGAGYVELLGTAPADAPHALVTRAWDLVPLADPRIGSIVVGPGLGRDADARARLDAALAVGKPLVIDADALSLIGRARHDRLAGHVITPHDGEYARLFGQRDGDRLVRARWAAAASGAIVLLKGADSVVAHPDGRAAIAPLAPAWLASAGTGDVLAGIIGSLIAQGLEPFEAAQAGLWLHGEAARRARPLLVADDLIDPLRGVAAACL